MRAPDATQDWAPLRVEMLTCMARAYADGSEAVRITARGSILWTDTQYGTEDGQLSYGRLRAAEQIAARLGRREFLDRIVAEEGASRSDRRDELVQIGRALYGDEWVSPTARLLDVAVRTVQRWAAGGADVAPNAATIDDLRTRARHVAPFVTHALRDRLAVLTSLTALD